MKNFFLRLGVSILIFSFIGFNSSVLLVSADPGNNNNNQNNNDNDKVNICHKADSENNPWQAIQVDSSSEQTHLDHGDFLYTGPTKDDGKPDNKDKQADDWCSDHVPTPPTPQTATISATKIVCDHESDLPNWGSGGPDITSSTASDFISFHSSSCHTAPWTFEWAPSGTSNPGDNIIGAAGGNWTPFTTTATVPAGDSVWVREQRQDGYVPFSGATSDLNSDTSKNSAELYCNTDVLNYDNYDSTGAVVGGQTYNCVAFNALKEAPQIENSCPAPNTLGDTTVETINPAPGQEQNLQDILTGASYTLNAQSDQKQFQSWDVSSGSQVTINAKYIAKFAANGNIFGYYTNGNMGTFTPIFKTLAVTGYESVPLYSDQPSFTITVPAGATTIGFAIKSYSGSTLSNTFASENSLNTGSKDHVVVYNPTADSYVLAFEDGVDFDFNDLVVTVNLSCGEVTPPPQTCDAGVNLIQNGGFETPDVATGTYSIIPDTNSLLKWLVAWTNPQTTGTLGLEIQDHVAGSPNIASGDQFAELDGDHPTTISQTIPTIVGDTYDLSFDYSARPGRNAADNQITVKADNTILGALLADDGTSLSDTSWHTLTRSFVATNTSTNIVFADTGTDTSYGGYLDNVKLTCNPNPNPECTATDVSNTYVSDATTKVGTDPAVVVSSPNAAWVTISGSSWIWYQDPTSDADAQNGITKTFTKTFSITGTPLDSSIDFAADNGYAVSVNGNPVPSCSNSGEFNYNSVHTCAIPASLLVSGSNTLSIDVTNLARGENSNGTLNPAGLIYKLMVHENDCVTPPTPTNGHVHIFKFIDGEQATTKSAGSVSFPMFTSTYSAPFTLGPNGWTTGDSAYEASTSEIQAGGAYTANEDTTTSLVGTSCDAKNHPAYELLGYSSGSTLDAAEHAEQSLTPPNFTINGDSYMIVWNKKCTEGSNTTLKVHIYKYLDNGDDGISQVPDNSTAPAFSMTATWQTSNLNGGASASGSYTLGTNYGGATLKYQADTASMAAPADYTTSEVTDGSVVVPTDSQSCPEGKYKLLGYKSSTTSLSDAESATLSTTAPSFSALGADAYVIVVNQSCDDTTPLPTNNTPTANAGEDQSISTSSTTLDGSASSDPDAGDTLTYTWTQVGTTPSVIDPADTESPSVTGLVTGSYTFQLVVTDNHGAVSAPDTVTITVSPTQNTPTLITTGGSFTSGGGFLKPQGQVLGASTSCGIYTDKFLRKGYKNDVDAVKKLQQFLNDYMKANIKVDGVFGAKTESWLKKFQLAHFDKILAPWGFKDPTGIFYLTTQTEVNNIMCPDLNLPIPTLTPIETNPLAPMKP